MHNRYSDSSTRPHSALVGSPFRNVVKRFDADIVKQHHIHTVSTAQSRITDQTEPVFAKILRKRGYESPSRNSSRPTSPDDSSASPYKQGQAYFNNRLSPIRGGGGGHDTSLGHAGTGNNNSSIAAQQQFSSTAPTFKTSLSSPAATGVSGGSPSSRRDMSIAAVTGSSDYKQFSPITKKKKNPGIGSSSSSPRSRSNSPSPSNKKKSSSVGGGGGGGGSFVVGNSSSNSVFLAHKQKVRDIANHGIPRSNKSKSPSRNPTTNSNNNNSYQQQQQQQHSPTSDANLIRRNSGLSRINNNQGGNAAYIDYNYYSPTNNNNATSSSRNRPNSSGSRQRNRGNNSHDGSAFGTNSSYQKWSHISPSQVANSGNGLLGGELFSIAMRGAQSQMDDAETMEVRREIQSAVDSFLYRPVARRFSEETAKWVEDHILPYAQTGTGSVSSAGGGNNNNRPSSAATTDSNTSGGGDGSGRFASGVDASIAARRQRALAMTEEVLPLMFHLVARDIRDAVRLRIETALLKKETRTSYLG